MSELNIMGMLAAHRIYCPSEDGFVHLLSVVEYAGTIGRLENLTGRLRYLSCREDEVILLYRDGKSEEMSFFWQQITKPEHTEALASIACYSAYATGWVPIRTNYPPPTRKTYHGGLICRKSYDPVEWTVHT